MPHPIMPNPPLPVDGTGEFSHGLKWSWTTLNSSKRRCQQEKRLMLRWVSLDPNNLQINRRTSSAARQNDFRNPVPVH